MWAIRTAVTMICHSCAPYSNTRLTEGRPTLYNTTAASVRISYWFEWLSHSKVAISSPNDTYTKGYPLDASCSLCELRAWFWTDSLADSSWGLGPQSPRFDSQSGHKPRRSDPDTLNRGGHLWSRKFLKYGIPYGTLSQTLRSLISSNPWYWSGYLQGTCKFPTLVRVPANPWHWLGYLYRPATGQGTFRVPV